MRIIYAILAVLIFVLITSSYFANHDISANAQLLAMAVVAAGALAGGDKE